jgi:hypothetical protein
MDISGKIFWRSADQRIMTGIRECSAGRMRKLSCVLSLDEVQGS